MLGRDLLFALSLLLFGFTPPLFGQEMETPSALVKKFLQQKGVQVKSTGLVAVWADTGETIFAWQENKPLIPASSLKVVTAYCALKQWGPQYTFETHIESAHPIQDGALPYLVIRGFGDPSLVSERLWLLVQELKRRGLKKITGDILLDASYFAAHDYPGRDGKNHRAYNALTSALAFNFNADPIDEGGEIRYRSVADPLAHFAKHLEQQLQTAGIAHTGKIRPGAKTAPARIVTFASLPLSRIVWGMNKFSNNFIAEQLVKSLGAEVFGPPGTTAKGVKVLKKCLQDIGVATAKVHLENGSGFSHENKIAAGDLARVLTAAARDFSISAEFISSLSIGGTDGTMKSRRIPKELHGIVKAKTGLLNSVITLAGYVPAQNGRLIAFCFLTNDFRGPYWRAQDDQEKLLLELRRIK